MGPCLPFARKWAALPLLLERQRKGRGPPSPFIEQRGGTLPFTDQRTKAPLPFQKTKEGTPLSLERSKGGPLLLDLKNKERRASFQTHTGRLGPSRSFLRTNGRPFPLLLTSKGTPSLTRQTKGRLSFSLERTKVQPFFPLLLKGRP